MNSLSEISFDPAKAISASSSSARVMSSVDQHRLDIASKERNSVLPWKGQFSPQLVEFLLSRHVNRQSLTLDPFCGSGTVLHEAARIGASAIGYDINPAAISLAKFPEICAAGLVERAHMLDDLMRLHSRLLIEATTSEGLISATKAADVLNTVEGFGHNRTLAVSFLLLAFGDSPETTIRKLQRSLAVASRKVAW